MSVTAIRNAPSGMPRPGKMLVRGARAAAEGVVRRNKVRIHVIGRYVDLPSGEQLVFLAGVDSAPGSLVLRRRRRARHSHDLYPGTSKNSWHDDGKSQSSSLAHAWWKAQFGAHCIVSGIESLFVSAPQHALPSGQSESIRQVYV